MPLARSLVTTGWSLGTVVDGGGGLVINYKYALE